MKLTKSILLVIAGVLIAGALFSFKKTSVQNEILIIQTSSYRISVILNGNELEVLKVHRGVSNIDISKILNKYAQDGWSLKTTVYNSATPINSDYYLERPKQ